MIIEYILTLVVYEIGLVLLFAPLLMFGQYLNGIVPESSPLYYAVMAYGAVVIGLYLFGLSYFAHNVTRRKVFENKTFRVSVNETVSDIRIFVAFIPIIGTWFQSGDDEPHMPGK